MVNLGSAMITLKKNNNYLKKHVTILKYVGSLMRQVLTVLCDDLTLFKYVIQDNRFIAAKLRGFFLHVSL
jgi:hypothetical protein